MKKRRRGTAIVETDKGIVLTSINGKTFILPGGGANKGESRFRAAIRELEEETGLTANNAQIIFQHESASHEHTVVLISAHGTPRPKHEVRYIEYYTYGKNICLSSGTREIINKYFDWKRNQ